MKDIIALRKTLIECLIIRDDLFIKLKHMNTKPFTGYPYITLHNFIKLLLSFRPKTYPKHEVSIFLQTFFYRNQEVYTFHFTHNIYLTVREMINIILLSLQYLY